MSVPEAGKPAGRCSCGHLWSDHEQFRRGDSSVIICALRRACGARDCTASYMMPFRNPAKTQPCVCGESFHACPHDHRMIEWAMRSIEEAVGTRDAVGAMTLLRTLAKDGHIRTCELIRNATDLKYQYMDGSSIVPDCFGCQAELLFEEGANRLPDRVIEALHRIVIHEENAETLDVIQRWIGGER